MAFLCGGRGTKKKKLVTQCRQMLQVGTDFFSELRPLNNQPDYMGNADAFSEAVKLQVSVASAGRARSACEEPSGSAGGLGIARRVVLCKMR